MHISNNRICIIVNDIFDGLQQWLYCICMWLINCLKFLPFVFIVLLLLNFYYFFLLIFIMLLLLLTGVLDVIKLAGVKCCMKKGEACG